MARDQREVAHVSQLRAWHRRTSVVMVTYADGSVYVTPDVRERAERLAEALADKAQDWVVAARQLKVA